MTGTRTRPAAVLTGAVLASLVLVAYLRELGRNPFGFFCDEALIGLQAKQLLDGTRAEGRVSFFYDHFGTVAGSLPVYATAPFVWLFGLDEFAVRLASAVFMLATLVVLLLTFRLLGIRTPWLPVLIVALSPVVIHVSRINFGHTPALFLTALGYYLFLLGRTRGRLWLSVPAGIAIGLSAYGYPGFYVATPVYIGALFLSELYATRFAPYWARHAIVVTGVALLCLLPIAHAALTNPDFGNRFAAKDKEGYGLVSIERAESVLQNYPKYYGLDFLFDTGETGLPGAFITRHSVTGAGLLGWVSLPLIVVGLMGLLFLPCRERRRAFLPFLLLSALFPLPDALTTRTSDAPYTFAVVTGVLLVPFVIAYGLEVLAAHRERLAASMPNDRSEGGRPLLTIWTRLIDARTIALVTVIGAVIFVFGTYPRYPLVSSDFWGWQAGPRQMIGYYLDHQEEYDAFVMEGRFNEPEIFLDFYIDDPAARARAFIGGQDRVDPTQRQLFGVSRETFENEWDRAAWTIVETVSYPDGTDAFYLVMRQGT